MSTKRLIQTAAVVLLVSTSLLQAFPCSLQAAWPWSGKHLDQTGCTCCPVCDHVCKFDAKQIEEERSCFTVEPKVICIPRVVFPWQKAAKAACASCDSCDGKGCTACVHNGARLRKVCVLKTEKYTCPACEYSWKAEKREDCTGLPGACDSGLGSGMPISPAAMPASPASPQTATDRLLVPELPTPAIMPPAPPTR